MSTQAPTLSMHNASVPALLRVLDSAEAILTKAKAHLEAKKASEDALLNSRLIVDMFPFVRQIQIVTDNVKGAVARLGGVDLPSYADTETTIDALIERVSKVRDFVKTVPENGFEGSEQKDIVLRFGPREFPFNGYSYLTGFVLPNTYFHLSMAYAIARTNGVELGKSDFLMG
jgi:uncharacterized protein